MILFVGALALPASVALGNQKAFSNAYTQVKAGTQSTAIADGLRFEHTDTSAVRVTDETRAGAPVTPIDSQVMTANVKGVFETDIDVKASAIHVASQDGVVTLSGTVKSPHAAETALRLALDSQGVKSVLSELTWPVKHH
jgi:hypothetical protein